MANFLEMGGYARFVWGAFGFSLVVLIGTVWLAKRGLRQTREQLTRRLQSQQGVQS